MAHKGHLLCVWKFHIFFLKCSLLGNGQPGDAQCQCWEDSGELLFLVVLVELLLQCLHYSASATTTKTPEETTKAETANGTTTDQTEMDETPNSSLGAGVWVGIALAIFFFTCLFLAIGIFVVLFLLSGCLPPGDDEGRVSLIFRALE